MLKSLQNQKFHDEWSLNSATGRIGKHYTKKQSKYGTHENREFIRNQFNNFTGSIAYIAQTE